MLKIILVITTSILSLHYFSRPSLNLSPGYTVEGKMAENFSVEWWQWVLSRNQEANPVTDLTGNHCQSGQTGSVWFLANSNGASRVHRVCEIPTDKHIFFPIVNVGFWPEKTFSETKCQQAKAYAALDNAETVELFAELDGLAIEDLKPQRVKSTACFDAMAKKEWYQFDAYRAYPSATDGYWLMLKPLEKGRHHLKFGGKLPDSDKKEGAILQYVEYDLTVK